MKTLAPKLALSIALSVGALPQIRSEQAQAPAAAHDSTAEKTPTASASGNDGSRAPKAASESNAKSAQTSSAETKPAAGQNAGDANKDATKSQSTTAAVGGDSAQKETAKNEKSAPSAPVAQQADPKAAATTKPATATGTPGRPLRIASKETGDHTAKELVGDKVSDRDGKKIGKIKDFLVDVESGRVTFAVVSSGGTLGVGDKLRLVPFDALRRAGSDSAFSVNVDENAWKQIATVEEDRLEDSTFTFADSERRRLAAPFAKGRKADAGSAFYTASISEHLVRASALEGRKVRAGNGGAGEIDGIVIDTNSKLASALFNPRRGFLDSHQKFLVPLEELSISGSKRPEIATSLTADDFKKTQTGERPAVAGVSNAKRGASPAAGEKVAAEKTNQQSAASNVAANAAKPNVGNEEAKPEQLASNSSNQPAPSATQAAPTSPAKAKSADSRAAATESTSAVSVASNSHGQHDPAQNAGPVAQDSSNMSASSKDKSATDLSAQQLAQADVKVDTSTAKTTKTTPAMASTPESQDVATATSGKHPIATEAPSAAKKDPQDAKETSSIAATNQPSAQLKNSKATEKVAKSSTSPSAVREDQPDRSDKPAAKAAAVATNEKNTSSTAGSDEKLSPTGKTSAEQTPTGDPALIEAAKAVRKALDDDAAAAKADVRVTPENGKLLLRGQVKTTDEQRAIEQLARKAAGSQEVQSELSSGK